MLELKNYCITEIENIQEVMTIGSGQMRVTNNLLSRKVTLSSRIVL